MSYVNQSSARIEYGGFYTPTVSSTYSHCLPYKCTISWYMTFQTQTFIIHFLFNPVIHYSAYNPDYLHLKGYTFISVADPDLELKGGGGGFFEM